MSLQIKDFAILKNDNEENLFYSERSEFALRQNIQLHSSERNKLNLLVCNRINGYLTNITIVLFGCRNGAFLAVLPGSFSMFEGDWPFTSSSSMDGINARHLSSSIGKHCYTIHIFFRVSDSNALIQFCEVKEEKSLVELFHKSFQCAGSIYPMVIVQGEATVSLLWTTSNSNFVFRHQDVIFLV